MKPLISCLKFLFDGEHGALGPALFALPTPVPCLSSGCGSEGVVITGESGDISGSGGGSDGGDSSGGKGEGS